MSRSLSTAKLRARRRSQSGGAIIFIVAMTLAVLGALGAYALTSASMEVKSAGYQRQAAQTHYLTEYAVELAAQAAGPDTAAAYLSDAAFSDTGCSGLTGASLIGVATPKCRRMTDADFKTYALPTPLVTWSSSTPATPGSLGAIPVTGSVVFEMTERTVAAPAPGFGTGWCFISTVVTAIGATYPQGGNATSVYAGEGVETARARVVGGPVQSGLCGGTGK